MIVVDSHCDTAVKLMEGVSLFESEGHWDLKRAAQYRGFVQFFAAFVSPEYSDPGQRCLALLQAIRQEIQNHREKIGIATNYADVEYGLRNNRTVALLAVEGGFGSDVSMVEKLYQEGVRCMSLSWNEDTPLCGGVFGTEGGVTELGKHAVAEMERFGILLDVSHASDQSFYELCGLTSRPFLATHSNSRTICPNLRNLTDEQFIVICRRGGMVGLNCYPLFLNGTKKAEVDDLRRHLEHFWSLGGENCVGLGCDFDGIDCCMNGFCGIQDYEFLYETLCKFYSEKLVKSLFYGNYLRFLQNNL